MFDMSLSLKDNLLIYARVRMRARTHAFRRDHATCNQDDRANYSIFTILILYLILPVYLHCVSHIFPIKLQTNINNKIIAILEYYKISGQSYNQIILFIV